MYWVVVNKPKVRWRDIGSGPEWTHDGGETWYYTFRSQSEFEAMHGPMELVGGTSAPDSDDAERELFGETLDEPIPDDLWEMIKG